MPFIFIITAFLGFIIGWNIGDDGQFHFGPNFVPFWHAVGGFVAAPITLGVLIAILPSLGRALQALFAFLGSLPGAIWRSVPKISLPAVSFRRLRRTIRRTRRRFSLGLKSLGKASFLVVFTLKAAWWLTKLPFKLVWWLIKLPFRAIWWLLKLPFRLLALVARGLLAVLGLLFEAADRTETALTRRTATP